MHHYTHYTPVPYSNIHSTCNFGSHMDTFKNSDPDFSDRIYNRNRMLQSFKGLSTPNGTPMPLGAVMPGLTQLPIVISIRNPIPLYPPIGILFLTPRVRATPQKSTAGGAHTKSPPPRGAVLIPKVHPRMVLIPTLCVTRIPTFAKLLAR